MTVSLIVVFTMGITSVLKLNAPKHISTILYKENKLLIRFIFHHCAGGIVCRAIFLSQVGNFQYAMPAIQYVCNIV